MVYGEHGGTTRMALRHNDPKHFFQPYQFCDSMSLCWTQTSTSMSLFCWGAQNKTQHFRCMSQFWVEGKDHIPSWSDDSFPQRILLDAFTMKAQCWLTAPLFYINIIMACHSIHWFHRVKKWLNKKGYRHIENIFKGMDKWGLSEKKKYITYLT